MKALVFGKFKVIHTGHLRLFRYALDLAEELHVGIDLNDSNEEEIILSLNFLKESPLISGVEVFNNLKNLVKKVGPDVIIRGSEFRNSSDQENEVLKNLGISLVFSSGSTYLNENDLGAAKISHSEKHELPFEFMQRNEISTRDLIRVIEEFTSVNVLVMGDLIVDEYINCRAIGMSAEEPVIVTSPISASKFIGGAGIVSRHSRALGANAKFITIKGDDELGEWASSSLSQEDVEVIAILDQSRPTTLKQRFKVDGKTSFRLNSFRDEPVLEDVKKQIRDAFYDYIQNVDLVIFSDFSYGVLPPELAREFVAYSIKKNKFVAADSQSSSQLGNLSKFSGAHLITPTEKEARFEVRDFDMNVARLASYIRENTSARYSILKINADGILLSGIDENGEEFMTERIEALNTKPVDVSGAGDSMLAGVSLGLTLSKNLHLSGVIGSLCSAIQVSKLGNIPVSKEELLFNLL
jgi:rfaE bifunctional protein kinase chain/domain